MVLRGSVALLALTLASLSNAATNMKMVESVQKSSLAAQGWAAAQSHVLVPQEEITLQIGLTLQNTDTMISKLLDTSNPKSKSYGKWMDRDDVNHLVQPSKEANTAVMNWLKAEGVTKIHSDNTWVSFTTTVETANRILNANFKQYKRRGVSKIRTMEYSVPQDVFHHIDIIHPTTFFGKTEAFTPTYYPEDKAHARSVRRQSSRTQSDAPYRKQHVGSLYRRQAPPPAPNTPSGFGEGNAPPEALTGKGPFFVDPSCNNGVGPSCLKQMYNIGNYSTSGPSKSRVGFSSFLNQSANYEDVFLYEKYFRLNNKNWTKIFVNNAVNNQDPNVAAELSGEAGLDAQNIIGVLSPSNISVFEYLTAGKPPFMPDLEITTPSENTNEPYVPYYQYLLSRKNSELPQVISNSYGEPEQTVPYRYAARTCLMIAMMGLRGISVLESSGDTGIGSYCRKNDGSNDATFLPEFPSTCPWVTSIGGTEGVSPEIAWRDSSGGFSYYFAQPRYQKRHVRDYLFGELPSEQVGAFLDGGYFNPNGRGFPDVSAHSLYPVYKVVYGGILSGSGGTSAASPVVAAILGLLNDARLRKGMPTLGFINPWLYDQGEEFLVDITKGAARGCDGTNHQNGKTTNGSAIIPGAFWNATKGWDAVTGMGIFDFQKALKNVLQD
ncbi:subtilisin-like protein [Microthyrium microscopicum]|uniref:tripeptidyl-peptidase II n=1 Tax=Microthyrium microscopicum TaxID=703497 RepID=A0A6A6UCX6_9PEZI|nr:subtilisin-like protein [Microthyrium microscopicum]